MEAQGISAPNKPTDYERGSRRSWIAVFGGLIGAFMAILDIQITNASMKEIQRQSWGNARRRQLDFNRVSGG